MRTNHKHAPLSSVPQPRCRSFSPELVPRRRYSRKLQNRNPVHAGKKKTQRSMPLTSTDRQPCITSSWQITSPSSSPLLSLSSSSTASAAAASHIVTIQHARRHAKHAENVVNNTIMQTVRTRTPHVNTNTWITWRDVNRQSQVLVNQWVSTSD